MTEQLALAMDAESDWALCGQCRTAIYGPRRRQNLMVCPECGHHDRVEAGRRVQQLFDPGTVVRIDRPVGASDPLAFVDTRPYVDRLQAARAATGRDEAVACYLSEVLGHPLVTAVMDFDFLGGSLGVDVGERITYAAEVALARRLPLLMVTASGGARMQEGALALFQMAKVSQALADLDEAGILTLTLITDPTYGGVAASFATLSDVIMAEPGARLGFAGPRVIEQTIREPLPAGFQTAEFLLERGLIDLIAPRSMLRATLARLLTVAGQRRGTGLLHSEAGRPTPADPVIRDPRRVDRIGAWEAVQGARDIRRPSTSDIIARVFEDFEELHGDRGGGDCPAIIGGTARLAGRALVVIGSQKGHDLTHLQATRFGMASPAGYRKAARLMRLAAKLRLPVLTLVDTPGAYPGPSAEESGQAIAIAENLRLMAKLPVPTVTVITGEGGSGGALALSVSDRVFMLSGAVLSVITPEGCAAILWKDAAAAPQAAAALRVDARQLLTLGVVDGVVPEPPGGSPTDHQATAETLAAAVTAALNHLCQLSPEELITQRHHKFRSIGLNATHREEQKR